MLIAKNLQKPGEEKTKVPLQQFVLKVIPFLSWEVTVLSVFILIVCGCVCRVM